MEIKLVGYNLKDLDGEESGTWERMSKCIPTIRKFRRSHRYCHVAYDGMPRPKAPSSLK